MASSIEGGGDDADPDDDEYETSLLGGTGEEYSRRIAMHLLTRASHDHRPFKLAIEFTAGGKFDDVAFYDGRTHEWWLLQAKHSVLPKELTWEAMFPRNSASSSSSDGGDFAMVRYFKSYLHVRQRRWRYGQGAKIRLVLFTNKRLQRTVKVKVVAVDRMLELVEGEHVQLLPELEELRTIKRHVYVEICDALVKLFSRGDSRVIKVLENHAKLVSHVLIKEGSNLRFSRNFLQNSNSNEFHTTLVDAFKNKDLSTLEVSIPAKLPDFWNITAEFKEDFQPFIDEDTVRAFFNDFILSFSQPNAESLARVTQTDWNNWMKSWIRPDVFRKLTENQLQEPCNSFATFFKAWENPYQKSTKRRFLTHSETASQLEAVRDSLKSYVKHYSRDAYVGLDAAEKYYVSRWIAFEKRQKASERFTDAGFAEWFLADWSAADRKCVALFGEPGMGKSTLWQHLAFYTQRTHADVAVLLVYLNDFKGKLLAVEEGTSAKDAVKILESIVSKQNMKLLLDEQQKVIVFMDAFDELEKMNQTSILHFVHVLSESHSRLKFLISGRKGCQEEFDQYKKLHFQTIELLPFDDSNRVDFLRLFWNVEDTSKFRIYSKELLRKFSCDVPRADFRFIGLPLMMKMLAEVFQDSFEQYLSSAEPESVLPDVPISVTFLYEQFTTKAILLALNKNWKLDIGSATFVRQFEPIISSAELNYQLLAMKQMYLSDMITEHHKAQLERFQKSIADGQEESLLLEIISRGTQFIHGSFAEFFCAKYLCDHVDTSEARASSKLKSLFKDKSALRKFYLRIVDAKLDSTRDSPIQRHLDFFKSAQEKVLIWACEDNCGKILSNTTGIDGLTVIDLSETTLLHKAASSNACEALQVLLKIPQKVDVENLLRETPLAVACEKGHLDAVKFLVAQGANVNHAPGKWMAPLNRAAYYAHLEIVQFLISNTAQINPPAGGDIHYTPLQLAAQSAHLEVVQFLVEKGASITAINWRHQTALHFAASSYRSEVAEYLLDHGANIDAQDADGNTALHVAAERGRSSVVLVDRNATIDLRNNKRQTALHLACCRPSTALVEDLLKRGADIHAWDDEGNTPLHLAAEREHCYVVQLLLEKGASVDQVNLSRQTALHRAVKKGHREVAKLLLEGGADRNAQDDDGNTPQQIGENHEYENVLEPAGRWGASSRGRSQSSYNRCAVV